MTMVGSALHRGSAGETIGSACCSRVSDIPQRHHRRPLPQYCRDLASAAFTNRGACTITEQGHLIF
jgi:hypothetical protein